MSIVQVSSQRLRLLARLTPVLLLAIVLIGWGLRALDRDDLLLAVLAVELPVTVYVSLALIALLSGVVSRSWPSFVVALVGAAVAVVPLGGWNIPARAAQAAPYTMITCNVEQWSHGGAVVGRAFVKLAPDVVCMQEAVSYTGGPGEPDWSSFQNAMPGYQLLRYGEIALATRWPVVNEQTVALPVGPDKRPLLDVTLRAPDGRKLHVISAHLVYNHYYGELPASLVKAAHARRQQVMQLLDHVATLDGAVVVCGDLNAAPSSVALSLLRAQFDDAWQLRGAGFGITFDNTWTGRRIDYMLVRGIELGAVQVVEKSLSDHHALIANFGFAKGR